MHKKIKDLVALTGLVALASVLVIGIGARVARAEGATVIDNFGCVIASADSGLPDVLFSEDSHAVETPSGNVNFACDFTFDPNLCPEGAGSPAIRHYGFQCGTQFGVTTNTKAITDCTEGEVHLSCQVNGSNR